jgi:cytochrome c-type biogenesis protein
MILYLVIMPGKLPIVDFEAKRSRSLRFWLIIISTALVALAGYLVFVVFLKEILPAFSAYSLYLVAVIAGIATFFSPCSFPLLPGYLSFYYNSGEKQGKKRELYYGLIAAMGVITFNVILGMVVALLGQAFASSLSISNQTPSVLTRIFRLVIGGVLLTLGTFQFSNITFHTRTLHLLTSKFSMKATSGEKGLYLYGFGYNAAGIGCAGPIMAGLIVLSLGSGGFVAAFLGFITYSLTMALLMIGISFLVAESKISLMNDLKASTPKIKKISSLLLVVVGVFLIYATLNLSFFVSFFFPK